MPEDSDLKTDTDRPAFRKIYPPEVAAQREHWLRLIMDVKARYVWPDPSSPTVTGLPQLKLTPDEWAAIKCQFLVEVEPFIHELVKLEMLAAYDNVSPEALVEP